MSTKDADIREKRLELVADAREIRSHRFRANVVAHIDGVEAKGVDCRFNGELMCVAKGDVRIEC